MDFYIRKTVFCKKFAGKVIWGMTVACGKCKLLVQRDDMPDHEQICESRELQLGHKHATNVGAPPERCVM